MNELQKEVFERLLPHQKRMVEEYSELDERTGKLGMFLDSDKFDELDIDEQRDMVAQYHAMVLYRMSLGSRLERIQVKDIFFPVADGSL